MVGAASQGIVQKGHQNQGTLYKTYYAPNPFDNVSAEEVEAYQQQFEDKRPGMCIAEEAYVLHCFILLSICSSVP